MGGAARAPTEAPRPASRSPQLHLGGLHAQRQHVIDGGIEGDVGVKSVLEPLRDHEPLLTPSADAVAHPFEGEISQGHYGAGSVVVWDRGCWEPAVEVRGGLEAGRLSFDLLCTGELLAMV